MQLESLARNLRRLGLKDVDEIRHLQQAAFPKEFRSDQWWTTYLLRGSKWKFGVFEDTLKSYLLANCKENESYIIAIAVHPQVEDQGYCRMLLQKYFRETRKKNISV